jgi:hypothetical protein
VGLTFFAFLFLSEYSSSSSEAGNTEVARGALDSPAFLVVILGNEVTIKTPNAEIDSFSLIC